MLRNFNWCLTMELEGGENQGGFQEKANCTEYSYLKRI